MDDDEYITISDDEDCQLIEHLVNLEPIIIDLTDCEEAESSRPEPNVERSDPREASSPTPPAAPKQQEVQQQEVRQQEIRQQEVRQQEIRQQEIRQQEIRQQEIRQQEIRQQEIRQQEARQQEARQQEAQQQEAQHQEAQQREAQQQEALREAQQQKSQQHKPQQHKPQQQKQQKPQMSDHELMVAQKALGNEKYRHNLFDDAIRTYKRANELAKKLGNKEMSAILHFNLAMTYYKLGSFDQAADECANAVKINDKYIKAHLKRAEIYQRQGKFEEAVICYEHICELDSTNQDYAILLNHAKEAAKHTKKRDHYQLLGLNYNTFTSADLKKAYRQSALNHHPDRHSDADIVTRRIEEKRFKEASEAHSFIQLRLGYRR